MVRGRRTGLLSVTGTACGPLTKAIPEGYISDLSWDQGSYNRNQGVYESPETGHSCMVQLVTTNP